MGGCDTSKDEMKPFARILLVLLAAQGLSLLPAHAQDSSAVAVNTRDGSSVFKLSFSVKRIMDNEVDTSNAAVAYASCEDCQTVAASIQIVLVMSDADTVEPSNLALSVNYECSECETLAAAYQYVFGNGEPVRFTAEGNQRLADIRRRFQELRHRNLTLDDLAKEIAVLAEEVAEVVDDELVATGRAGAPGQLASTTTVPPTSTSTSIGATSTSVVTSTTTAPSTTTTVPATTTTTPPATTTTSSTVG